MYELYLNSELKKLTYFNGFDNSDDYDAEGSGHSGDSVRVLDKLYLQI